MPVEGMKGATDRLEGEESIVLGVEVLDLVLLVAVLGDVPPEDNI